MFHSSFFRFGFIFPFHFSQFDVSFFFLSFRFDFTFSFSLRFDIFNFVIFFSLPFFLFGSIFPISLLSSSFLFPSFRYDFSFPFSFRFYISNFSYSFNSIIHSPFSLSVRFLPSFYFSVRSFLFFNSIFHPHLLLLLLFRISSFSPRFGVSFLFPSGPVSRSLSSSLPARANIAKIVTRLVNTRGVTFGPVRGGAPKPLISRPTRKRRVNFQRASVYAVFVAAITSVVP